MHGAVLTVKYFTVFITKYLLPFRIVVAAFKIPNRLRCLDLSSWKMMTMTIAWSVLFLVVAVSIGTVASRGVGQGRTVVLLNNGYLVDGKAVGNFTSQIQKHVFPLFENITKENWMNVSMINQSSGLRYLKMTGDYEADVPLRLPSLFCLMLNGSISDAANFTFGATKHSAAVPSEFAALVTMNSTWYSAVIGGTYDSTRHLSTQAQAITIVSGNRNTIRQVRARSHFSSAIGIYQGSTNEISGCDVGGDSETSISARGIWTLATERSLIHNNRVHHCASHALDFDAYTSFSVAYSNICESNGEEGIFVEETAHDNVIASNLCRKNRNGIGVYSNAVGPVARNMFVGNIVEDNDGYGITCGGYGHDPTKHSERNTFVANDAVGNLAAGFNPMHGSVFGDFWIGNRYSSEGGNGVGGPKWSVVPNANANTSSFDP